MVCRSKGGSQMILSHKEIEEIAAAVTKDFNEFFFGPDTDGRRLPRGTPIDQFAREYLGLNVSFAYLSEDGSICGLTAYTDTCLLYTSWQCPLSMWVAITYSYLPFSHSSANCFPISCACSGVT